MSGQTRVVFMGSPEFAVPSLRALVEGGFEVVLAVSQPDRAAGRGGRMHEPPVKVAARELGIPAFQPDTLKDDDARATLAATNADVFVVAAYGKILPRAVLAMPAKGCVNVHASLLPRWRGASPINAAILAGDPVTGVSIMELEPKMDTGPVIVVREEPIRPDDTAGTLEPRLAALGAQLLVESLAGWLAGDLMAQPQDESLASYCGLIRKEDGELRAAMTADEAERAVRAYSPWPGASVGYGNERLSIWASHIAPGTAEPGTLSVIERRPGVAFAGGWLVLDEVQRPGRKRLPGDAFLNGERGALPPTVGLA